MAQADFNHFTHLNLEQLRKLARILYYQEVEAIKNIEFESEAKLAKYLQDSKACCDSAMRLLDSATKLEPWFDHDDKVRDSIAHDIYCYTVNSANHAIQYVKNFHVRMDYVNKIEKHVDELRGKLDDDRTDMEELAKEAHKFRNDLLEIARGSPAARQYSAWIEATGMTIKELVQRYQTELGYGGRSFADLKDYEKIHYMLTRRVIAIHKVYGTMVSKSGRANIAVTAHPMDYGGVGKAVLVFGLGVLIWVLPADNPLQTAARNALSNIASDGSALGDVTAVVLSVVTDEALLGLVIASIGICSLIGGITVWLINEIFGSGGSGPLSTTGHQCYVAQLPDGEVLAREIAHQQS
ncbi:uncharacterized protein [Pyrus communis]|uniref:uncharacterized protein n=1 Tax=Pyrus communis TaxID=23211 RepID=UPI0035C0AF78